MRLNKIDEPFRGRRKLSTILTSLFGLVFFLSLTGALKAQSFQTIPALSFSKTFAGADPLPQILTIASTGAQLTFTVAASTSSGGSWLKVSPGSGTTPEAITATVTVPVALAAGTYSGQIVVTEYYHGIIKMTIPVSLTISQASTAFFDNLPGGMSFSLQTGGGTPPNQTVQIRNAGSGALNWTVAATTADGGKWLTVPVTSGAAPALFTAGIKVASLPGGGQVAGTYVGQLRFQTSGSAVTIPVSVVVGDSVFPQVNAIGFSKPYAGLNPLPQVLTLSSTNTAITFTAVAYTGNGGSWLTVSPGSGTTPDAFVVSVNAAAALAAGTYTGEVVFVEYYHGSLSVTVPVTLTVAPSSAAFFDNLPGQMSFSLQTGGNAPPTQAVQIRNAGSGTLNWTLAATTADGGNWLSVSPASGTAPSTIVAGINPAALPGGGQIAGTYIGELTFQSSGQIVTIPVSVLVGDSVFRQVNGIGFSKPYAGIDPLPQTITVASTNSAATGITFVATATTGTGGNWLSVSPASGTTPQSFKVSVSAAASLAAGTYTGQVVFREYYHGDMAMTVPVTLTISPSSVAFFDNLPGQMSFSLPTAGSTPPNQTVQIRNGGSGTLNWTLTGSTSDGGNWLTVSGASGTAPSLITVGINLANLAGGGQIPGTYTGQLVFKGAGETVTIPVSLTIGDTVFKQVNPISFVKPSAGANPLPQTFAVISTGSPITYTIVASTSKGGSWLKASAASGTSPEQITVSVNADPSLPAGTYTGQVVFTEYYHGDLSMTVPVTLTVAPTNTAFFDNIQGQMSYSFQAGTTNPPSETIQLRNEGTGGPLNWTLSGSTSDGGSWLTVSATSGTAPANIGVGIITQNLPGGGLLEDTYVGQLVFLSSSGTVTVPVSVTIGPNVFVQPAPLSFSKAFGGSNPLSQTLNIASTGTAITFVDVATSGNGGNWLQISPASGTTPKAMTISVNAALSLPTGVYTGEIVVTEYYHGSVAMTIPVYLMVGGGGGTGIPASLTATGGTPQSATVTTAFATQLSATVKDSGSHPISGVTVTFTAPSTGPSGTFAGGVNTAVTNAQGVATSPVFTANSTVGSYTVTATAAGLTTNPGFSLSNVADVPAVTAAIPSSGSGATQTFQFTFNEPTGWQNLNVIDVLINNALDGRHACYAAYVRSANIVYLVTDDGSGLSAPITLNGSGSVSNSQCTINGAGSSASGSGNTLTLNLNITFLSAFTGNKVMYAAAGNQAQNNSGWAAAGVWQVPGSSATALKVQGMTPSAGHGHSQAFTFTFTDTNGVADIGVVDMLMNSALDGRHACYVAYVRSANIVYLVSDDGATLLGPIPLNGSGSVSNSQCTINGTGSSMTTSGNSMIVTLNYTFNNSFIGDRIFYLAAGNASSSFNTGWQALGAWTVQ